jgi:hypothetical protein
VKLFTDKEFGLILEALGTTKDKATERVTAAKSDLET